MSLRVFSYNFFGKDNNAVCDILNYKEYCTSNCTSSFIRKTIYFYKKIMNKIIYMPYHQSLSAK